jgi:TolB-like protein
MSSTPLLAHAAFLSYASQDADRARRICEGLRAAGVEVWFDQSGLVGGDAWDTKIRGRISSCTLFVPIISANTQARREGYFRLEWKLAAQRTHMIADGTPFLLPVVIDEVRDGDALVPPEFRGVQWTRLPDGHTTPDFVRQVQLLLAGQATGDASAAPTAGPAVSPATAAPAVAATAPAAAPAAMPRSSRTGSARWRWLGAGAVVGCALLAYLRPWVTAPTDSPTTQQTPSAAPATAAPTPPKPDPGAPVPAAAAITDKSVAVLPFANLSAEKDSEFFADGVHEDLLTDLAKVRDLKVISRASVLGYRDATQRNLRQIGIDLGVAHILEGSVRRSGNKVRINVQLIDARTDRNIWAETYDRDLADVFAVQSEVAREITGALKVTLRPSEQQLIGRRLTTSQNAYDWFARGRGLEQDLSISDQLSRYEAVVAAYTRALEYDPSFAQAWAQLAALHGTMYWFGSADPSPERRRLAFAALDQARALAPDAPETRVAEGNVRYRCENDWTGALARFTEVEGQLPNDAQLQANIALAYRRLGRWSEAVQRFERSVELNPKDRLASTSLVETQITLRRYSQALETVRRIELRFPGDEVLRGYRLMAELERDGDWPAFIQGLASGSAADEIDRLQRDFDRTLLSGDLSGTLRVLADRRFQFRTFSLLRNTGSAVPEQISFIRAEIAAAMGDRTEAVRSGREALHTFGTMPWSPRQRGLVRALAARAQLIVDPSGSVTELRAALTEMREFDKMILTGNAVPSARTLAAIGRKEDALAFLEEALAAPTKESPQQIRHDPLFRSLRDDPRFEQLLRSAPTF